MQGLLLYRNWLIGQLAKALTANRSDRYTSDRRVLRMHGVQRLAHVQTRAYY